ncbi:MAG TPA: ribosomal RNA small subunit methyltransferase A [Elusimicrobia bacterium]|nr:MAG: ribosomal RNA small subunit methyltransferase A [Elusimicrobia bacterium GWF2_62_30]HBA61392.1 ribosomal RNA small subunit methyltransferase A [Elusimicrobiota bacterium]
MPKYSQVFLHDKNVRSRIAAAAGEAQFELLVEIGPGKGALTGLLFPEYGPRLLAVEIDPAMAAILKAAHPGLELINRDFMELDLPALTAGRKTAFIGNLPYECSTAILEKTLACPDFELGVFMFQREVARKICARPGAHDYSYLSVISQAQAQAELLLDVPAGCFTPVPEVDSSVLVFRPRRALPSPAAFAAFSSFLKAAFAHRRKTLINSLALSGKYSKAGVSAILEKQGHKLTCRPQELTGAEFLALLRELEKI